MPHYYACYASLLCLLCLTGSLTSQLLHGPAEVLMGLSYGIVVGLLCWVLPNRHHAACALLQFSLLIAAGLFALFGSQKVRITIFIVHRNSPDSPWSSALVRFGTFPLRAHVTFFQVSYTLLLLFRCLFLPLASPTLFSCGRYPVCNTELVHGIPVFCSQY